MKTEVTLRLKLTSKCVPFYLFPTWANYNSNQNNCQLIPSLAWCKYVTQYT